MQLQRVSSAAVAGSTKWSAARRDKAVRGVKRPAAQRNAAWPPRTGSSLAQRRRLPPAADRVRDADAQFLTTRTAGRKATALEARPEGRSIDCIVTRNCMSLGAHAVSMHEARAWPMRHVHTPHSRRGPK
eukprot:354455-Chlamydomonas_euryale.AAC.3